MMETLYVGLLMLSTLLGSVALGVGLFVIVPPDGINTEKEKKSCT